MPQAVTGLLVRFRWPTYRRLHGEHTTQPGVLARSDTEETAHHLEGRIGLDQVPLQLFVLAGGSKIRDHRPEHVAVECDAQAVGLQRADAIEVGEVQFA